jgi:hypothetical protein
MIYIVVRYNCNVLLLTAIPPVIRSAASLLTIADTRKAERLFDFSPANVIPFFPVTPRTDLVEFDRVFHGNYLKGSRKRWARCVSQSLSFRSSFPCCSAITTNFVSAQNGCFCVGALRRSSERFTATVPGPAFTARTSAVSPFVSADFCRNRLR